MEEEAYNQALAIILLYVNTRQYGSQKAIQLHFNVSQALLCE